MSFFSDLFQGNFSNLGSDLAPSNIFSDTASSFANQPGWAQALEIAAPIALTGGLLAAPELLGGGAALGGAAAEGGLAAADVGAGTADLTTLGGAGAAGIGAGADVTAGAGLGDFAGVPLAGLDPSLISTGADAALPDTAALTSGTQSAFGGAGTAFDMGGGGTIDPAVAASSGISAPPVPYSGVTGGVPPTDAAFGPLGTNAVPYAGITGGVPPAGATAPASPGLLSTIGAGIKEAAPFVGVAGLGASLYSGYEQSQALKSLNAQEQQRTQQLDAISAAATSAAQPLLSSGTALTQYLQTGTLPQAFQDQLTQAVNAAKAQRIQAAASMGQSTNPLYNTALAQDLSAIDMQAQSQKANIEQTLQQAGTQMVQTANTLLAQGVSATEVAAQLPIAVQNLDIKLAQMTSQSIGAFAAAMNGGQRGGAPGTLTLSVNPQGTGITGVS